MDSGFYIASHAEDPLLFNVDVTIPDFSKSQSPKLAYCALLKVELLE